MSEEVIVTPTIDRLREPIVSPEDVSSFSLIPFDGSEAPELKDWFEHDTEVGKHYYTNKGITDYQTFAHEISNGKKSVFWRVVEDGKFCGFIHADQVAGDPDIFSIGVVIPEKNRRKGLAKKSVTRLVEHAREKGLKKAIAKIADDNTASIALFEKAGFTKSEERNGNKSVWEMDLTSMKI